MADRRVVCSVWLAACAALLENLLKYSLQIFLSMFAIAPFITRTGYHEATQICDENFYNMDSWMAWGKSTAESRPSALVGPASSKLEPLS